MRRDISTVITVGIILVVLLSGLILPTVLLNTQNKTMLAASFVENKESEIEEEPLPTPENTDYLSLLRLLSEEEIAYRMQKWRHGRRVVAENMKTDISLDAAAYLAKDMIHSLLQRSGLNEKINMEALTLINGELYKKTSVSGYGWWALHFSAGNDLYFYVRVDAMAGVVLWLDIGVYASASWRIQITEEEQQALLTLYQNYLGIPVKEITSEKEEKDISFYAQAKNKDYYIAVTHELNNKENLTEGELIGLGILYDKEEGYWWRDSVSLNA
ncbi:MAG: hypothetical protein ACOX3W_00715 [Christensenellaceae bacterium]|jgi:hypothetical protein